MCSKMTAGSNVNIHTYDSREVKIQYVDTFVKQLLTVFVLVGYFFSKGQKANNFIL